MIHAKNEKFSSFSEKRSEGYSLQACHYINIECDIYYWTPWFEVTMMLVHVGLLGEQHRVDVG